MGFLSLSHRCCSAQNVPSGKEQGETVVFAGYLYISPPQTPWEVVYKPRAHNCQFMVILDNSTDVMPKTTLAMPGQQLIIIMSTFGLLSLPFALLNSLWTGSFLIFTSWKKLIQFQITVGFGLKFVITLKWGPVRGTWIMIRIHTLGVESRVLYIQRRYQFLLYTAV